jgi:transcriptional regulator with XRE-family HTH domain
MPKRTEHPDLEARFRERFVEARKRNGFSQEEVADDLGITQQTVARFENSKRGMSLNDMPKWAAAIGEDWRSLVVDEMPGGSKSELRRALSDKRAELGMRRAEAGNAAAALERAQQQLRLRESDARRTQALLAAARSAIADLERQIDEMDG